VELRICYEAADLLGTADFAADFASRAVTTLRICLVLFIALLRAVHIPKPAKLPFPVSVAI